MARSSEFSKKVRIEAFKRCAGKCEADDLIRESVAYDPYTGKLSWKIEGREVTGFSNEGYRRVKIAQKTYQAHRVAWLLHHGAWPSGIIDHINGNKGDNRISNLRIVTIRENGMNRKLTEGSKSGVLGVTWAARQKAWKVQLNRLHLGYFKEKDAAIRTRKEAEEAAGYSPFHGRLTNA